MTDTMSRSLTMSRSEAEDFLYREARLLDEWRLDDWLALFTRDGSQIVIAGADAVQRFATADGAPTGPALTDLIGDKVIVYKRLEHWTITRKTELTRA